MYNAFFGFQKAPFASAPDPEFFFRSNHHDAALKGLLLSVEARMGLISLMGDEGTGKTVVLECLRNSLGPEIPCGFIRNSCISFDRFLETIASDLDLRSKTKSTLQVFLAFTRFATEQARSGRTVVLIVDEAHTLPMNVFHEIVHTASLQHEKVKAIQTVFAGRPELQPRLASLNRDRVGQRALLSRSLYQFTATETQEYIEFRLARAGMPKQTVFPRKALEAIYERSQGFAPAIHALCDSLLLRAFSSTSKICTKEMTDELFKKRPSRIMEDAPIVAATVRILPSFVAPPPAPEPPPMQTTLLRVVVDARLGSLCPRPVSADGRTSDLSAINVSMAFPRGRFALAPTELGWGPIQPMPREGCAKASILRPVIDPGSAISPFPVTGLFPLLPETVAEARTPRSLRPPASNLMPLGSNLRPRPALAVTHTLAGPFPELFSPVLEPMCPGGSFRRASVILASSVPFALMRITKNGGPANDGPAFRPANTGSFPFPFTGVSEPIHPTAALQPASIIPCSLLPLTPSHAIRLAPLPPSASRFVEVQPENLVPAAPATTVLGASLHPAAGGPAALLPLPFSAQPIPAPAETSVRDIVSVAPTLQTRRPILRLRPADPSSPARWISRILNSNIPWPSPAETVTATRKRLGSFHRTSLLAIVIPILAALALHSAPPALRAAAEASRQGWRGARQAVLNRAAIALDEDFRAGLSDWTDRGGSPPSWTSDASGFVHPGALAFYRPSQGMSDYQMQFLGTIDKKGLSWVARAVDFNNYYVIRLTVLKSGPLPLIGVSRYAVIHGVPQKQFTTTLLMTAQADTVYHVLLDIQGDRFALSIQDQPVDSWSESNLRRGSIGFFSEKDARSRIASLHVRGHYDMLGRLCAFLMPSGISNNR